MPDPDPVRVQIALEAAAAAVAGEPVADDRLPARRAAAVIAAIRAHERAPAAHEDA